MINTDGLVDSGFKHLRVSHDCKLSLFRRTQVNLIKLTKRCFIYILKKEYRFNHRHRNLYLDLFKLLHKDPLNLYK